MILLFAAAMASGYFVTSEPSLTPRCATVVIDRPGRPDLDGLIPDSANICWSSVALKFAEAE